MLLDSNSMIARLSSANSPLTGGSTNRPWWEIPESMPDSDLGAVTFEVTASVDVADRYPSLRITDQQGNTAMRFVSGEAITAEEVVRVSFVKGLSGTTKEDDKLVIGIGCVRLRPGDEVAVFGFESADSFTGALLTLYF